MGADIGDICLGRSGNTHNRTPKASARRIFMAQQWVAVAVVGNATGRCVGRDWCRAGLGWGADLVHSLLFIGNEELRHARSLPKAQARASSPPSLLLSRDAPPCFAAAGLDGQRLVGRAAWSSSRRRQGPADAVEDRWPRAWITAIDMPRNGGRQFRAGWQVGRLAGVRDGSGERQCCAFSVQPPGEVRVEKSD
jgi:hypothetical protein